MGGDGRDANGAQILVETKRRHANVKVINRKGANVSAAQRYGWIRHASAQQTIVFVQYELKSNAARTGTGVGQQSPLQWLVAWLQRQDHLHAGPTMVQRPKHARHQPTPQISSTTV